MSRIGRRFAIRGFWARDVHLIAKSGACLGTARHQEQGYDDPDPDEPAGFIATDPDLHFSENGTARYSGHINENPYERNGRRIVHEGFVARHIGHDLVLTKYVTDRKQPAPPDPDLSLPPTREPVPEPVVGL